MTTIAPTMGASWALSCMHAEECNANMSRPRGGRRNKNFVYDGNAPRANTYEAWGRQLGDPTCTIRGYCHVCDHRVWYFDAELCGMCGNMVHGTDNNCFMNGACQHQKCAIKIHGCDIHYRVVCMNCVNSGWFCLERMALGCCSEAIRHVDNSYASLEYRSLSDGYVMEKCRNPRVPQPVDGCPTNWTAMGMLRDTGSISVFNASGEGSSSDANV